MSRGLSFRETTTLAACAYAALLGVLTLALGRDLWTPVANLAPQVSWLMHDTTHVRMAALTAIGRPETAALYALAATVSWCLIMSFCAAGFAWGLLNKGATVLGLDKALGYLTALAALYGLATGLEVLLHLVGAHPRGGLHAIPGLWFFAMIPSAAILARCGALIAHDVGALIGVAVDGEPTQLAALVATAEETRGPRSVEARVARLIAARRAAI